MPLPIHAALAETTDSPVDEVVAQVSDIIETAGDRAGNFLSGLPMLTTKLLMAALAIFLGVIIIRIGRRVISSIVGMRGQKGMKSVQQVNTVRSLVTSIFNYIMYFIIVTINGLSGVVESIAIRTTVVRDYNGNVYVIPNGDIRTLTNMSRGYKRAIVDIRCPYEADQGHIVEILKDEMEKAGREIDGLTAAPEVMSILSFETDAVVVRIAAQCPIGEHWRIERDLRTRVKARFDSEGIVMPHYQKVVINQ